VTRHRLGLGRLRRDCELTVPVDRIENGPELLHQGLQSRRKGHTVELQPLDPQRRRGEARVSQPFDGHPGLLVQTQRVLGQPSVERQQLVALRAPQGAARQLAEPEQLDAQRLYQLVAPADRRSLVEPLDAHRLVRGHHLRLAGGEHPGQGVLERGEDGKIHAVFETCVSETRPEPYFQALQNPVQMDGDRRAERAVELAAVVDGLAGHVDSFPPGCSSPGSTAWDRVVDILLQGNARPRFSRRDRHFDEARSPLAEAQGPLTGWEAQVPENRGLRRARKACSEKNTGSDGVGRAVAEGTAGSWLVSASGPVADRRSRRALGLPGHLPTVPIVPVLNFDGHERVSPYNRANRTASIWYPAHSTADRYFGEGWSSGTIV